jgi:predicted RNA-binding Zn ribbon-like protein
MGQVIDLLGPDAEALLLELLNSTAVGESGVEDTLADDEQAHRWALAHGGVGSPAEATHLREARDVLQRVIWGRRTADDLDLLIGGARWEPQLQETGLSLALAVDDDARRLAVRALLAWGAVTRDLPGRLRACANTECRLFLLDRSHANTARWCSMAVCGNRMKARRHHQRSRSTT